MKTTIEQTVSKKSIFDMTASEIKEHIRPTAEKAIQHAFDKDSYITYFDEAVCSDGMLIREYRDHKELVIFKDGKATFVRNL